MKRTGPTGRAKSVHTRREVYMPRTPNIREDTRRSFNPTSINSADHSLMPMTAASTSDFQRRPDLGFSTPADTDPPTTPSLFCCPTRCAMTDRGSVFKVTRRCNGTIPFGLGSTSKVPRRSPATRLPCSALPRGTPSPELGVPSSEFRVRRCAQPPSRLVRTTWAPRGPKYIRHTRVRS